MTLKPRTYFLYLSVCTFLCCNVSVAYSQKSNKSKANNEKKETKELNEEKLALQEWNDYFEISNELILENKVSGLAKSIAFTKKYPNNAAGYAMLGDFYLENNQLSNSLESYKKAIQLDNSERWYSLKLAKAYQLGSMYKEAISIYEDLFKKNTEDPSPLFYVFQIYNSQKKYAEAASTLEKIRGSVGDSYEMSLDLQRMYFKAGNYKASLHELELLKKMRPEDPDNYGKSAEIYLALGNKDKAMEEFNQVLKINPNDDQIHFSLASYYSNLGQWEKTIHHLGKGIGNAGIDIDKKVMILLSLMDVNQLKNGMYTDSIENMVNVLTDVHPGSAKAFSIKGDFYLSVYKYDLAANAYLKVTELDKNKWAVWSQLMYVKRLMEDYSNLLNIASEVQDLYPNNPESYLYKSVSYNFLNESNKALREYESGYDLLFDIGELSSAFWVSKAEIEMRASKYQISKSLFNTALDQAPGNVDAKIKLAYLLLFEANGINEAEKLLMESEKQSFDLFYFYACKGLLHLRKNNQAEAQNMLDLAIKFGGESHSWTLELKGDLLSLKGNNSEAISLWRKAQAKGWNSSWLNRKIEAGKWVE